MTSCEIVLQYACEDTLDPTKKYRSGNNIGSPRDGTPRDANDAATDRIPDKEATAPAANTNNRRYGMHESVDFYADCKARSRNKGLFIADQNVRNNKGARATRQNPNGNRRGLECPEERDYYPYWAPTPWRDVAVITSNPERCGYYQKESENIKGRVAQSGAKYTRPASTTSRRLLSKKPGDEWTESDAAVFASETVDCVDGRNSNSRHNQLGNALNTASPDPTIPHGINANRYIWTVPNNLQENCVLRLRYNISTMDYYDWDNAGKPMTDAASNPPGRRRARRRAPPPAPVPNGTVVNPIVQDPYMPLDTIDTAFLSLATNTNQYGRTFQDRSYVFAIKARPNGVAADAKVYNVGVRGKRGNIVQTYPAVEYDFMPNDLCINKGDYVHFQWTGSDYNPNRNPNDAEGAGDNADGRRRDRRADRSNLVDQDDQPKMQYEVKGRRRATMKQVGLSGAGKDAAGVAVGMSYSAGALTQPWDKLDATTYKGMFWTEAGQPDKAKIMEMAYLRQEQGKAGKCKTAAQLAAINNNNQRERDPLNCAKLNAAADSNGQRTPYFDGGLSKMNKGGTFSYMSTRNHNFSNRNQVGYMCVKDGSTGQCSAGKTCESMVEQSRLTKLKTNAMLVELNQVREEEDRKNLIQTKLGEAQDELAAALAKVNALKEQL